MAGLSDIIDFVKEKIGSERIESIKEALPQRLFRESNKESWQDNRQIQEIFDDDPIIKRMVEVESSNDPNARSRPGAVGLMQVMEATAKDPGFGVTPMNPNDRTDPLKNVQFGAEYFNALKNKFNGDDRLALIAYNWGYGNTRKWAAAGADPNKLPSETRGYLEKILGGESTMEEPEGMASYEIEDEVITASAKGGRIERDPYNNYNKQRII
tara:strand:+ start:35 stop:670 length:636 start_codon:yes stop_codon:yes gene_type:complete